MGVRRKGRVTAFAACALACGLGLSLWLVARGADNSARADSSVLIQRQPWGPPATTPLAACGARIEREPRRLPTIAIVYAGCRPSRSSAPRIPPA
jgi:hypothetical protein